MKKPESSEVAGHVPDDVARVLISIALLWRNTVHEMCDYQLSKAAEEGVWVQGGGIVIPCTYILYGKQLDRPHVSSELKKNSIKKRTRVEDCGTDQDRKRKRF